MKWTILLVMLGVFSIVNAQEVDIVAKLKGTQEQLYKDGLITNLYHADIDGDGIEDTMTIVMYTSSTFPMMEVAMIKGANEHRLDWKIEYYAGSVVTLSYVHPDWLLTENTPFYNVLVKMFLDPKGNKHACYDWLMSLSEVDIDQAIDTLFDNRYRFNVNWQQGPLTLPRDYTVELDGEQTYRLLKKLPFTHFELPEWFNANSRCVVFFDGRKLWNSSRVSPSRNGYDTDSVKVIPRTELSVYKAYKLKHGVAVYDSVADSYQWIFQSGNDVTGGPDKLGWESIWDVKLHGHCAFILQAEPLYNKYDLWMVDVKKGILAKVANTTDPLESWDTDPVLVVTQHQVKLMYDDSVLTWDIDALEDALAQ